MATVQSRPMTEARCSLCGWSEVAPRPAPEECPQCHGICPTCFAGGVDVMQEDVRSILNVLGLGDHARPISCHEVIQREILPAIRDLRAKAAFRSTTLPRDPEMFRVAKPDPPQQA